MREEPQPPRRSSWRSSLSTTTRWRRISSTTTFSGSSARGRFDLAQLVAFGSLSHFYRPVIDIYFAVMTPLLGGSPVLFHAASIALHAANVLVVFALARRILPPEGGRHIRL